MSFGIAFGHMQQDRGLSTIQADADGCVASWGQIVSYWSAPHLVARLSAPQFRHSVTGC
jgi:hypothetical protein